MSNTLFISSLFAKAHAVSAEVPDRTGEKVFLHLLSEVGELSEEASIHVGELYKSPGPDGVVGEACDVLNCLADLLWIRMRMLPVRDLSNAIEAIESQAGNMDLDTLHCEPFKMVKSRFAQVASDLRSIYDMTREKHHSLTIQEARDLAALILATLSLAKSADPTITSAGFLGLYDAKCQKWRSKALSTAVPHTP